MAHERTSNSEWKHTCEHKHPHTHTHTLKHAYRDEQTKIQQTLHRLITIEHFKMLFRL